MKLLYDTGEQILGTREDVKEYLKENLKLAVESAEDEELKEFYITETNFLLEEIDGKYKDEEYIGLSDCPMAGFYMIDMKLVKEWKEREIKMNELDYEIIADNVLSFLFHQFELQKTLTAGQLRQCSGDTVEEMIDLIWTQISKFYPNIKSEIIKGKLRPYRIIDNEGNMIEESVDRHCYINDKMVLGIECKTYLDKCYMQRADSDFSLMKSNNTSFQGIVVTYENATANNAFNFFINRKNIDKVYFLSTHRRSGAASERIYNHFERIDKIMIINLIKYLEGFYYGNY